MGRKIRHCRVAGCAVAPMPRGQYCPEHRASTKAKGRRERAARRYAALKARAAEQGLCIKAFSCTEPCSDTSLLCAKHAEEDRVSNKRYMQTATSRRRRAQDRRRFVRERAELGLCCRCNGPARGELCETHRREKNARDIKRYRAAGMKPKRCSMCSELGHDKRTCNRTDIFFRVQDLYQYATGRNDGGIG